MALKDILVHIDNAPHCAGRLALAINLARKYQARLTGLYVITHPHYQPQSENAKIMLDEARKNFEQATTLADVSAEWINVDWPVMGMSTTKIIIMYAYQKDLVIVGQAQLGADNYGTPSDLPEQVVAGAGRPVLIVPYAGTFETIGERIMVAWKNGRESTRALNDSMVFLQDAEYIRLMEINPIAHLNAESMLSSDAVCAHLQCHGIKASSEQLQSIEIAIGDTLLNQAWEQGCDLLVMGAYTNTPRKLVLGNVAKHVLKHMTMPVLMSH